jgi:hypothetical protein
MSEAETEWFACADPRPMLAFLRSKGRDRKLRLFACACCLRTEQFLTDEQNRHAIDVVEQFWDGKVVHKVYATAEIAAADSVAALRRAVAANQSASGSSNSQGVKLLSYQFAAEAVLGCFGKSFVDVAAECRGALRGFQTADIEDDDESRKQGESIEAAELVVQAALIRDIFGNPFRPVNVDGSWLTPPVVALAHDIYENRTFDRMPLLADALQESGCNNADILDHFRSDGPHVRGCWVVDLVLGKE